MRRFLALTTALSLTLCFAPMAVANHQYQYSNNNDVYNPSTKNLYRRTQRAHTCQLPSQYQGSTTSTNSFQGWLLPGLIWGDCPLRFPNLIRAQENSSAPFGRLNW